MASWLALYSVYSQHHHFISYMVVILLHIIWHCCDAATVFALNEHKDVFNNYSDTFLIGVMGDEPVCT